MKINEMVARLAWALAGNYEYGHNIGCLADDLAKAMQVEYPNDAATEIRNAIELGIQEADGEHYTNRESGDKFLAFGRISLAGDDVWYIICNAYTEWVSDCPDWWESMIARSDVYRVGAS